MPSCELTTQAFVDLVNLTPAPDPSILGRRTRDTGHGTRGTGPVP